MLLQMTSSPQTPAARTGRAWLTVVLLALGLALLVWLVRKLDLRWDDVQTGFWKIGWWFIAILGLTLARFALRSLAWMTLTGRPIPLASAVAATISGDALGNITPLGLAASEPAKSLYLRHHAVPAATFASLTAENFFYSVSVALYVMVASGALLLSFDHLNPTIHLAGVVALSSMAAVLGGAAWLAWQKPTLVSATLARLPIRSLHTLVERIRLFEQQTYGAAGHQGNRLAVVTGCEVAFHLLSLFECWLTFWLLTGVTALTPALIYDGFNRVVNIVAKPIPGRIGVEEGGTAALALAIGYSAADGFMLAIVRKLRMLVFAVIGLALWVRDSRR